MSSSSNSSSGSIRNPENSSESFLQSTVSSYALIALSHFLMYSEGASPPPNSSPQYTPIDGYSPRSYSCHITPSSHPNGGSPTTVVREWVSSSRHATTQHLFPRTC